MFFFYITIILVSFFHVHSLTCKLMLTCKASCDNAIKINWEDNAETSINLGTPNDNTATFNKEYPETNFQCEPGDKIKFNNNAYEVSTYEGGFIGKLIVGSETFQSDSTPTTIFACNSGCTTSSSTLNFYGESNQITMLEFSSQQETITIEIPYEINNINTVSFSIIESNQQSFKFEDYISPKINGATKERLKVKIISIPNFSILQKNSNNIAENGEVSLDDSITFSISGDNFGLFELTYKVKILSQEEATTHSIQFNVCYKYCSVCGTYTAINPASASCTSCIYGTYKIDDTSPDIDRTRCFSLEEIDQKEIYYLPQDGTTFMKCDNNCYTCKLFSYNCFSCQANYYFNSDEVNKCQGSQTGNYFSK